jgi:hypothetical protein
VSGVEVVLAVIVRKEVVSLQFVEPRLKQSVFQSYIQDFVVFAYDFDARLSICLPLAFKVAQLFVEFVHGLFLCAFGKLLTESCEFVNFLDEDFVKLHLVIELLPKDFVFEHHIFAMFDSNQLEEEVF